MPYSSDLGKAFTDRAIIRLAKQLDTIFFRHKTILDLGVGSGTYINRYGNTWLPRNQIKWTGVEIWEPYIERFSLNSIYDKLVIADVRDYARNAVHLGNIQYDICFIGDLVEHMTKDDAVELVINASRLADLVIISIPISHYPQDEWEGNPYEKHVKDDWSHDEVMSSFSNIISFCQDGDIGVYLVSNTVNTGLIKQVLRPQIGVYSICKDEIKFIDRFYDSIEDADFVSICDTGSTDGTWENLVDKVKHRVVKFGHEEELSITKNVATDGALHVTKLHVSPWRFDDARNAALSLLPEEIDLVISVDIDEVLMPGWRKELEDLVITHLQNTGRSPARINHRFETIWDWDTNEVNVSSHWHERIHSRKGFQWKLPVHEILINHDPHETLWLHNWKIVQLPDTSKPRGSYWQLLEQSVIENPRIWKSWSFLAAERMNAVGVDSALEAIVKAKELPDSDKAYLGYQASNFLSGTGRVDEAIQELFSSTLASPNVREYKYYLAILLQSAGRINEALIVMESAAKITTMTNGYEHNAVAWGSAFNDTLLQLRT